MKKRYITSNSILFFIIAISYLSCKRTIQQKNDVKVDNMNSETKLFIEKSKIEGMKVKIRNIIIDKNKPPFASLFELKEHLIYFYPNDICDICNIDLFHQLTIYKNEKFYNEVIVLVPLESYRDFVMYNKEYNLNFTQVYTYRDELIENQQYLDGATFFHLAGDFIVKNVFIPKKPIDSTKIVNYFDGIKY